MDRIGEWTREPRSEGWMLPRIHDQGGDGSALR